MGNNCYGKGGSRPSRPPPPVINSNPYQVQSPGGYPSHYPPTNNVIRPQQGINVHNINPMLINIPVGPQQSDFPIINGNKASVNYFDPIIQQQTPISTTTTTSFPRVNVRALYKYQGQHDDDLPFEKDDLMIVQCDRSEAWWLAEHTRTKKKGYIPSNYVVIDDGLPTSHDAWYDISRQEADRLLLLMGNVKGTYILRPCSDRRNQYYALSVRHYDETRNLYIVKHYKIRTLDSSGGYYISQRRSFPTISDLIDYYSNYMDGLCCRLTNACPRDYKPPVQFRDMVINRQCIKLYEKLGHGSFGEVRLGRWNDSVEVAVKLLKPNSMDRDKFISEAELMHKLHHEKIVQILGICKDPPDEPVYIVTELMQKGSLLHFLQGEEGRALKPDQLVNMMAQVSKGMAYLESMNFVHRDLRAANILVGLNLLVKVADFGLARVTQDDGDVYRAEDGTKFPIKWTAPEAALNRIFSVKSDVWSFGILMYEIITYGRTPYPSMSNRQVIDEISKGYRMPRPEGPSIHCSIDLYNVMLNCWDSEPAKRPTFAYLKDVFDNWSVIGDAHYLEN